MDKYFGWLQGLGTVFVLLATWLFGAWDNLIATMITFVILDYATGILGAIVQREISSAIGFKGIVKKIMLFIIIAVAVQLDRQFNTNSALRNSVISFFMANEGLSILENAGKFLPLPSGLKTMLLQLRNRKDGEL